MKSRQILIAVALVLTAEGAVWADFALTGTEHLDVITSHTTGVLFDASTADVLADGYIEDAYVDDEALLQVMRPSGKAIDTAWAYETARIAVSSGKVYHLSAYNASSVDISGGIVGSLNAYNASSVDISGGGVSSLYAYETSSVAISGGDVSSYLYAYETSSVDITTGSVFTLYARETSSVTIFGGSVTYLNAYDASSVDISGGSVATYLNAYGASSVDISGGGVPSVYAYETSSVDISGGDASSLDLYAYETSTITLHGFDFRATGGLSLVGDEVIGTGVLTGKWFDGTTWIIDIGTNAAGATIRTNSDPAEVLLPGDADCNRTVNLADLSILAFNWDTPSGATWWLGDFDGDGDVDLSDLSALAFNWEQSCTNPPVPEPATLALLASGVAIIVRRGRIRRQPRRSR